MRSDLQTDYQVIEITEEIISFGMSLAETQGLRGYDAVQLAAGCVINELCVANGLLSIIFVPADEELNLAAVKEGLLIENRNHYPYSTVHLKLRSGWDNGQTTKLLESELVRRGRS